MAEGDIEPAEGGHRGALARAQQYGRHRAFHDRRARDLLPRRQRVEVVDRSRDPVVEINSALGTGRGWRRSGQSWFLRQRRKNAGDGDPRVDQHRLLIGQRIGVELLVTAVKQLDELRQRVGSRPIDPVEPDRDLEDLLAIAHIDRPRRPRRAIERGAQPSQALRLHLLEQALQRSAVERSGVADMAARDLEAQIGRQHAPR